MRERGVGVGHARADGGHALCCPPLGARGGGSSKAERSWSLPLVASHMDHRGSGWGRAVGGAHRSRAVEMAPQPREARRSRMIPPLAHRQRGRPDGKPRGLCGGGQPRGDERGRVAKVEARGGGGRREAAAAAARGARGVCPLAAAAAAAAPVPVELVQVGAVGDLEKEEVAAHAVLVQAGRRE